MCHASGRASRHHGYFDPHFFFQIGQIATSLMSTMLITIVVR